MKKKYFIAPSVYEQQKRLDNSVPFFEILNNFLQDSRMFFERRAEDGFGNKKPYTQGRLSKDLLIAWFKVKENFFDSGLFKSITEVEAYYPLIKFSPFLATYNKLAECLPDLSQLRMSNIVSSETFNQQMKGFYQQYAAQFLKEARADEQVIIQRQKQLNKMVYSYYVTLQKNYQQKEFYCFKFRLHIPKSCLWVDFYQTMQETYKQFNAFFIANDQATIRGFVFDPIMYHLELRFVTMGFNRFNDQAMLSCLDGINNNAAIGFELFDSEFHPAPQHIVDFQIYDPLMLYHFFGVQERKLWHTHLDGARCFQVLNRQAFHDKAKWRE